MYECLTSIALTWSPHHMKCDTHLLSSKSRFYKENVFQYSHVKNVRLVLFCFLFFCVFSARSFSDTHRAGPATYFRLNSCNIFFTPPTVPWIEKCVKTQLFPLVYQEKKRVFNLFSNRWIAHTKEKLFCECMEQQKQLVKLSSWHTFYFIANLLR